MVWPSQILISLLLIYTPPITMADASMSSFCSKVPNFGRATYDKDRNSCKVTYQVYTGSEVAAREFCDMQHPYTLRDVKNGQQTTCEIIAELECNYAETLIGERCFSYETDGEHAQGDSRCKYQGHQYEFHRVYSTFEQKWIATFFSHYTIMWVRNTNADLEHLLVANLEGKVLRNRLARLGEGSSNTYAIILRKGSTAPIKAGALAPMLKNTVLPVLCSRPATPRQEYFVSIANRMGEAGYKSTMATDMSGLQRPFTVIRGLHSFTISHDYDAGTERIHHSCEAFENGYAASPFDFQNIEDFKKVLREAAVNIVAVPGHRNPDHKVANLQDCTRDPRFMDQRKQFYIDIKRADGGTFTKNVGNDSMWAKGFPDRTCADMPRVALAFTQNGLVDVPNIARLFVVCTYGALPNVQPDDGSERCDPKATFDRINKKCKCKAGFDDLKTQKILIPRPTDQSLEEGTACLNCQKSKGMDIFFVLDYAPKDKGYFTWCIVKCIRISLVYYQAAVRMLLLGGETGIRHDTYSFIQKTYTEINKDEMYGMTDDYWKGYSVGNKLTPGLERAYKALEDRPGKRKLLVLLLDDVPNDIEKAVETLKRLRRASEKTHVEVFVGSRLGHSEAKMKALSTSTHVYKIGSTHADACTFSSLITNIMLRLQCTM